MKLDTAGRVWSLGAPGSPISASVRPAASLRSLLADQTRLGHYQAGELLAVSAFTMLTTAILGAALALSLGALSWMPGWARVLVQLAATAGAGCIAYGILIEPYRLRVNVVRLRSGKIRSPVRAVHLSDLHVRDWSRVEEALAARVRELAPDLILMTGDYTTLPCSLPAIARLLRELSAVAPTYASLGNCELLRPVHKSLPASEVVWLANRTETVLCGSTRLKITGVDAGDEASFRRLSATVDATAYAICLYHYPDLVPDLPRIGCDLMLCGHTHGGQIRLPWLGALISLSRAGTRHARGLFQAADQAAYVSQGIGSEGYGLPRMRFLCPPEIVLLDLRPA